MHGQAPALAEVQTFSGKLVVYGQGGEIHRLSLEPHLTASEKRELPESDCGRLWVRRVAFEAQAASLC